MSLDLSTIGRLLREAREAKGIALEDASSALFLRKSIIGALEKGEWDKLPHEVYVKGYLNQYASYLKMDDQIAALIQKCDESSEPREGVTEKVKEAVAVRPRLVERLRAFMPSRKLVTFGLGLTILVAFIVYQNVQKPYPLPRPAGSYDVSNTAYETTAKQADTSAPAVLEMKKLVIACKERTWVRVLIDGTEKKEFMLNPEEMVAFNAREGFDLLIGNAGGVTLLYDGKNIGLEGGNGEVKRVKLPE